MDTVTLVGTGFVVLAGFLWIFCAYLAYIKAPTFGRRGWLWGLFGILIGPIAVMVLYILPKHEPDAGEGQKKKADPHDALYEVPKKH